MMCAIQNMKRIKNNLQVKLKWPIKYTAKPWFQIGSFRDQLLKSYLFHYCLKSFLVVQRNPQQTDKYIIHPITINVLHHQIKEQKNMQKQLQNSTTFKLNFEFPYHLHPASFFLKTEPNFAQETLIQFTNFAMGTIYLFFYKCMGKHNTTPKLQCKAELYMVKLKRIYFIELNKEIIGLLLLFFK